MNIWLQRIGCLVLVLMTAPALAASGPDMEPGLWEITSRVKMPGMELPANTMTQCITKESLVPQGGSGPGQNQCEISDVRIEGDTVSWSITCDSQEGVMTGSGETTYDGDSFEGSSKMSMQGMEITTTMSGKRIGACP